MLPMNGSDGCEECRGPKPGGDHLCKRCRVDSQARRLIAQAVALRSSLAATPAVWREWTADAEAWLRGEDADAERPHGEHAK